MGLMQTGDGRMLHNGEASGRGQGHSKLVGRLAAKPRWSAQEILQDKPPDPLRQSPAGRGGTRGLGKKEYHRRHQKRPEAAR